MAQDRRVTNLLSILYVMGRVGISGTPAFRAACAKSDSWVAYGYAMYILKGRFPEGEAQIAKDRRVSDYYCSGCLYMGLDETDEWMRQHQTPAYRKYNSRRFAATYPFL